MAYAMAIHRPEGRRAVSKVSGDNDLNNAELLAFVELSRDLGLPSAPSGAMASSPFPGRA
jgi:hypothetical protein